MRSHIVESVPSLHEAGLFRYSNDAPGREGWSSVKPDDYYWDYEDEE